MAKVSFNTDVLKWGMDRYDFTPTELSSKFPLIQDWLSGEKEPTYIQLEDLAKTIHIPFGYLFLKQIPQIESPIHLYRTIKDEKPYKPSPELVDTVYDMQRRQAWLHEYLYENEAEKLAFVGSAKQGDNPAIIAGRIKQVLHLTDDWADEFQTWIDALRYFRRAVENAGILVVANGVVGNNTHRALNVEEFRGFVLVDDYAPLIFINNADSKAAQMFTIAHELAHVWFGSSAAFDLRQLLPAENETEKLCNQVAAELLISSESLRAFWNVIDHNDDMYENIARKYKVSEIVVARRLLDCGFITKSEFFQFYESHITNLPHTKEHKASGGDFYLNQGLKVGVRFMKAVVDAVHVGDLQYIDAYRLTGLYGASFNSFADKVHESN